ncbi:MAG: hypothetical protein B6I37_02345 [Desulfobacteraceae bacterium 4572_35.2]|nr:MAG: hypothetical protein B6I37_02345 [Desulfobacteraceae bacterium 4572_35.2]
MVVSLDLTALKQKIYELYPEQKIEVYGSETGVVLAGTVSGPEIRSGHAVTNLLHVEGIQQVMLEVKFAEVSRNSIRDLQVAMGLNDIGNQFLGTIGVANVSNDIFGSAFKVGEDLFPNGSMPHDPGSLLGNFAGINNNVFAKFDNITTALEFLETEGLARLLAEPRLVTMSGQEASFLAGGEFPIPVPQGDGDITIEFREFGVGLIFTPVVLSDGKISLRVSPSVTRTTADSAIKIGSGGEQEFFIPSLSTRKLETTVQLYDGQTLALAGLLEDNLRETVRKVPGLGDIPVLGALFRSSDYQQEKTDLLITVTPHLVQPVKEGSIRYPGEFFQPPNAFEFYLEGRLEGERSADDVSAVTVHSFETRAMPVESQGGLEGTFGHQPVSAQ